jgi:hypothetical protein
MRGGIPGYIVQDVSAGKSAVIEGDGVKVLIQAGATTIDTQVRLRRLATTEVPEEDRVVFESREAIFKVELVDPADAANTTPPDLLKPILIERDLPADWLAENVNMALLTLDPQDLPVDRYKYEASEIKVSTSAELALTVGQTAYSAVQEVKFIFGFGEASVDDDRYMSIKSPTPISSIERITKKTVETASSTGTTSTTGDSTTGSSTGGDTGDQTPNSGWGSTFKLVDSGTSQPYLPAVNDDGLSLIMYNLSGSGLAFRSYDLASGIRGTANDLLAATINKARPYFVDDSRAVLYYSSYSTGQTYERVVPLSTLTPESAASLPTSLQSSLNHGIFTGAGQGVFITGGGFGTFSVGGSYQNVTGQTNVYGDSCDYSPHDQFIYCHMGDESSPTKLIRCSTAGSCTDLHTFTTGYDKGSVRVLSASRIMVILSKDTGMTSRDITFVEWDLTGSTIVDQKTYPALLYGGLIGVGNVWQVEAADGRLWGLFSNFNSGKIFLVQRDASGQWSNATEIQGSFPPAAQDDTAFSLADNGHGFVAWTDNNGDLYTSIVINLVPSTPTLLTSNVNSGSGQLASAISPQGHYGILCYKIDTTTWCAEYVPQN